MNLSDWSKKEYSHIKPGLRRIKNFLYSAGIHAGSIPFVHIAGTNAKGSVAAFLSSIFAKSGLKTGLYTSPHLVRVNERIKINGKDISDEKLYQYYRRYSSKFERFGLSFFEAATAISYSYFVDEKVDVAVLEVGVGGALDATNVFEGKLVSVITNTGYDHIDLFGNDIKAILKEDLGILQRDIPVVIGNMKPALLSETLRTARNLGAKAFVLGRDFDAKLVRTDWQKKRQLLDYFDGSITLKNIGIRLMGAYQISNAAVATAAAILCREKFKGITGKSIAKGLAAARWPARFDVRKYGGNTLIIDGAHNFPAVATFVNAYKKSPFCGRKTRLLFSLLKEKDYKSIIREISKIAGSVHIYDLGIPRMQDARLLKKEFEKYLPPAKVVITDDLKKELLAPSQTPIVVAGSLYLAGKILEILNLES